MTAPLSIIIPTLNAQSGLKTLLPQLMDGLTTGLIAEVIFADGGSTDATLAIAEDVGAKLIKAPKGRGTQLAAGCKAAKGAWLLVLHADSGLPSTWTDTVQTQMERAPDRAAAFRLALRSNHPMARITAGWANLRTNTFSLPYGDQGLLIPARLYNKIGGYPEIPLMEDVALAKALKGRIDLMPATVTSDASKYERDGWLRRGTRNLLTLIRYKLGASPQQLLKSYDRPNHKS